MVQFHPEEEQAEFNQSIDILYKIAKTRAKICELMFCKEYLEQYYATKIYYFLLEPMFNETEIKKHNTMIQTVRQQMKKIQQSVNIQKKNVDYELIECLDGWFRELNKDAQKHGLLMIKKRDSRYALGNK